MDLNDIRRAAIGARQFTHAIEHVSFTVQVPTSHETELAAHRAGEAENRGSATVIAKRALLEQAIVAWSGVLVRDVLATHGDATEVLEHSREAVSLLMDERPEWAAELGNELLTRIEQRLERKAKAAKN